MKFWDRDKEKLKENYASGEAEKANEKNSSAAAKAAANFVRFNSFIDEAISEHKKEGGFEHLEGKGKPVGWDYFQTDVMDHILKKNDFVPDWILLKQEIWNEIKTLKLAIESGEAVGINEEIARINKKIVKYNNTVPSLSLQRGILFEDNIALQYERWQ